MHIVQIASELAPIAKVGGLGDVLQGLSKALQAQGHQVELLLPKYDGIAWDQLDQLHVELRGLLSLEAGQRYENVVWKGLSDQLPVYLIEPHHPHYYFARDEIYGYQDDVDRFFYFCKAALDLLFQTRREVDILHLHDWPTALVALLYQEVYVPLGYRRPKVVLTLHNLHHQGLASLANLTQLGLRPESFLHRVQDLYRPSLVNTLQGALHYADALTTVSPTYQREIQTVEGGCGLHTLLKQQRSKLVGILNGLDADYWDPARDPYLFAPLPTARGRILEPPALDALIEAKRENRRRLSAQLSLPYEPTRPLLISVGRLSHQKAPHLIQRALLHALEKGAQCILLGSSPDPECQPILRALEQQMQQAQQGGRLLIAKDEALAHLLFAAADLLVMPSLFEPCGLTQLIAMRYGTVPVVRKTGGLADTVFDVATSPELLTRRNGFTFDFPDEEGLLWALDRALTLWTDDQPAWRELMRNGLSYDSSWDAAARSYLQVYQRALAKKGGAREAPGK